MIADHSVPPGLEPAASSADGTIRRARWSGGELVALATRLVAGAAGLRAILAEDLYGAWERALIPLLTSDSKLREQLSPAMATGAALSPEALRAALDAMLAGSIGPPAQQLIARGREGTATTHGLVLAVVAGNIPALAVQVVLPALAAGRPLLIKSASDEPLFAAALVRGLAREIPEIGDALAAVTWEGGRQDIEQPLLQEVSTLVAYGRKNTLSDLRQHFDGRMIEFGPRFSIAVISSDIDPASCATGLAEDIALFEQRGCLSVQTIFTDAPPRPLADALTKALEKQAAEWPPLPLAPRLAGEIQQLRHQAALEGAMVSSLPIRLGTVLTVASEPMSALHPLPGGRTVRIQRVADLGDLPRALDEWRGHIQGAALAGSAAVALEQQLRALGVNRCALPGSLQRPDALWANGDEHLMEALQ
jgi:hypothetical protein